MKTVFNWLNPTRFSKSWTLGCFFQRQDGAADDNPKSQSIESWLLKIRIPLLDYELIPIQRVVFHPRTNHINQRTNHIISY